MTKPAPISLETAVQACARLGFKPGDVLTSRFWDGVPLRIDEIREKDLWVTQMRYVLGQWRAGASHAMRYLPADVALAKEGK
jgi:hypothetical protein